MHQDFTRDAARLYIEAVAEIREAPDDTIAQRTAFLGLANDQLLAPQLPPFDPILCTQGMRARQGGEDAFGPKLFHIAIGGDRRPDGENNIEGTLPDEGNMLDRRALPNIEIDLGWRSR